jgi:hypothetical protein
LAAAREAPTPTRMEVEGTRPVLAFAVKASESAKDTAAYWDRWVGIVVSSTCPVIKSAKSQKFRKEGREWQYKLEGGKRVAVKEGR